MRLFDLKALPALVLAVTLSCVAPLHADQHDGFAQSMVTGVSTFPQALGAGVEQFGKANYRVDLTGGSFPSLKTSQGRAVARGWTRYLGKMDGLASRASGSLPFRMAPGLLMAAEAAPDVLARASAGDYQGAIAGAGAIAVGEAFTAGGAAMGGAAGASALGAVGSAVPVIGNVLGVTIGGAVGRIAGGFIAATAYDLLVKDGVSGAIEGWIAPLFDRRSARVIAYQEMLRAKASQELKEVMERFYPISESFGQRSVELIPPPTILRLSAVSGAAERVGQPKAPPELIALTSFDAVLVSVSIEMADGSNQHLTAEEINTIGAPFDCYVLSFRDGAFSLTCDHGYELPQNGGVVHSDWQYKALGVSDGTRFSGTSLSWTRIYSVGLDNMSDGEANRHAYVSVVTGDIDPHGRVTMIEEPVQQENASAKWETGQNGYQINTGSFYSYAAERTPVARTLTTYQIDPGSYDGRLLLPNLTADDIRATEFELPDVFFQHGVSPPDRIR